MKRIRDKEIPNLELLRDIYEKDRATGTKARTAKERLRQWEETNTIDEVDQLQAENVVILENLEDPHTSPKLENSNGASSSNKTLKKSSSKLSVKRKHDDINSEEKKGKNSTNPIEEGLKNVNESMAEIARALNEANDRLDRSTIRIYSATEIYAELEKHGVPDNKLLKAANFLKTNNEKADTFFCCPERLKRQWLERNGF
ncbi:hypothetical protein FCM35_KLT08891 [Carex littledalei]|uniref:Uncharacterized protein n=1 Tax=Carex littledalei TaxID=544730 RepID=A0A833V5K3_9POAL|nr:hypothetical protein FCM35_KLT08891 [Carex littledalei]